MGGFFHICVCVCVCIQHALKVDVFQYVCHDLGVIMSSKHPCLCVTDRRRNTIISFDNRAAA